MQVERGGGGCGAAWEEGADKAGWKVVAAGRAITGELMPF